MTEVEVVRLKELLNRWCHAEGGLEQEKLFEETQDVLSCPICKGEGVLPPCEYATCVHAKPGHVCKPCPCQKEGD